MPIKRHVTGDDCVDVISILQQQQQQQQSRLSGVYLVTRVRSGLRDVSYTFFDARKDDSYTGQGRVAAHGIIIIIIIIINRFV